MQRGIDMNITVKKFMDTLAKDMEDSKNNKIVLLKRNMTSQEEWERVVEKKAREDADKMRSEYEAKKGLYEYFCMAEEIHEKGIDNVRLKSLNMAYKLLSELLEVYQFNAKECDEVVSYMVASNIDILVKTNPNLVNDKVYFFNHEEASRINQGKVNEAMNFLKSGEYNYLIGKRKNNQSLTEEEEQKLNRLEPLIKKLQSPEQSRLLLSLRKLKEYYLVDNPKQIKVIIKCLTYLEVQEPILSQIQRALEKKQNRFVESTPALEPKVDGNETDVSSTVEQVECVIDPLDEVVIHSDRAKKLIRKELSKYFNFEEMKPIRVLRMEEQIYCVSLLLKLGEKETIRKFLNYSYEEIKKQGATVYFDHLLPKLRYYEEDYHLPVSLIIDYISEMVHAVDEQEYETYKSWIETEVNGLEYKLPDNYDYEIERALQLLHEESSD